MKYGSTTETVRAHGGNDTYSARQSGALTRMRFAVDVSHGGVASRNVCLFVQASFRLEVPVESSETLTMRPHWTRIVGLVCRKWANGQQASEQPNDFDSCQMLGNWVY